MNYIDLACNHEGGVEPNSKLSDYILRVNLDNQSINKKNHQSMKASCQQLMISPTKNSINRTRLTYLSQLSVLLVANQNKYLRRNS